MNVVETILMWIWENIFDIALVAVGASAFITYYWQKSNEKRAAATLILDQIDSIEKVVRGLKEEYHHNNEDLNDHAVYLSKEIVYSGVWDKYQYLMVRMLSQSELDLIQSFFASSYQIEKARADIVYSFKLGWKYKTLARSLIVAKFMDPTYEADMETKKQLVQHYLDDAEVSHQFNPKIAYDVLYAELNSFQMLSGTTAYEKLYKKSFRR